LNFERIQDAVDDKMRSIRIDHEYRAIVVQPPKGDVFLCVWVDHHDKAYRWARKKRFEVNPTLGVFQLFEMVEPDVAAQEQQADRVREAPDAAPTPARPRLFEGHDDEDLLLAGVPAPLLDTVCGLCSEEELDALAPHLPSDAAEMLYHLAAGYSLVEAMEEADRSKAEPEKVDVQDFGAALARPESRQAFRILESDEDLEAMLDAPLDQWRIFLHPTQRKLVRMNANGPVRVLGGAGTGKTVVLMHRAKHLAENVFAGDEDRILVTTYTKNLALNLRSNIANLCPRAIKRIEIAHLHSWAAQFLHKQGHRFRMVPSDQRTRFFEAAIAEAGEDDFTLSFVMDEWDAVVQPQDVDSRDAYFTARRVGRGTRLSRKQRLALWRVFARYREILDTEEFAEWPDLIRETRLFIEKQGLRLPYRAVLADEVQDFTPSELRLVRAISPEAPNSLFLVGDGHQRIYASPTRMSACGIHIRGRSRRLKLNYRTTEEIRDRAVAILKGCEIDDLDGGVDSLKGYFSLRQGPVPEIRLFTKEVDEAIFVVQRIRDWIELQGVAPDAICVAARSGSQINDRYEPLLKNAGIATVAVLRDPEAESLEAGIRIATMHRMKGIEFSRVLLAGVQDGTVPHRRSSTFDDAEEKSRLLQERCLLYVAATRARDELVITGYGDPSPFL
jgi:hypothetical protein